MPYEYNSFSILYCRHRLPTASPRHVGVPADPTNESPAATGDVRQWRQGHSLRVDSSGGGPLPDIQTTGGSGPAGIVECQLSSLT